MLLPLQLQRKRKQNDYDWRMRIWIGRGLGFLMLMLRLRNGIDDKGRRNRKLRRRGNWIRGWVCFIGEGRRGRMVVEGDGLDGWGGRVGNRNKLKLLQRRKLKRQHPQRMIKRYNGYADRCTYAMYPNLTPNA